MRTHEQLVGELMKRPGVKDEVESLEREEGALLDKQIQAHQANSKVIEYTDEPIGKIKRTSDFLPSGSKLNFDESKD